MCGGLLTHLPVLEESSRSAPPPARDWRFSALPLHLPSCHQRLSEAVNLRRAPDESLLP